VAAVLKGFTQQFVPWSCDVGNGVVFRGGQMPRTGKPVLHFAHGNGFSGLVYRELLARLEQDTWRGRTTLRLNVVDAR